MFFQMTETEPKSHYFGMCCECNADLEISGSLVKGEVMTCADCGIDLEVIAIDGDTFQVEYAPQESEDWGE